MQKLCSKDPSGKGVHCFCIDIDIQRGVKNAADVTSGMFKETIGQRMKTLDKINQKSTKLSIC